MKLLSGKSATPHTQSRRAYAHDFELAPEQAGYETNDKREDSSAPFSELSADSHLVRSIQDLLVNINKQRNSKSDHTATMQKTGSNKTPRRPNLRNMSPVHPAAILADNWTPLFDDNGTHR